MNDAVVKKRIYMVDAHRATGAGVRSWVNAQKDMIMPGVAANGRELFALLAIAVPDALVLALSLGDTEGVDLLKEIRKRGYEFPIVVFTMHDESLYARQVFENGAQGYLTKDAGSDELVRDLRAVLAGNTAWSQPALELLRGTGNRKELDTLSGQETQVFSLVAQGKTNRQIAQMLGTVEGCIHSIKSRIRKKLGLKEKDDLIARAVLYRHRRHTGCIEPPLPDNAADSWMI